MHVVTRLLWTSSLLWGCSHEHAVDNRQGSDASLDVVAAEDAATSVSDAAVAHDAAQATNMDAAVLRADATTAPPTRLPPYMAPAPPEDEPGHVSDDPTPPEHDASTPDASADAGKAPVLCDATLSYDSFGRTFMNTYCLSCHGFKTEPLFTTLDRVAKYKDEMIVRVLYEDIDALHMPPYGRPQPSTAEAKQLEQWLTCGPK